MKNDNRGLSLVELIVSVTILSIIMIGVWGMLSVMSRNFSLSQKEVELQNNVQATYTVVSDLIREAQQLNNKNAVTFSGGVATIHSDTLGTDSSNNKVVTANRTYYVVLDKGKLYIGDDGGDSSKTSASFVNPNNLLASNVSDFDVDVENIKDGYVVLSLACKYGEREASISQNVYLRNSNVSAGYGSTSHQIGTGDETYHDYHVTNVNSVTNNHGKYEIDEKVEASDFEIKGTLTKDDGSDVKTDVIIPVDKVVGIYDSNTLTEGADGKKTFGGTQIAKFPSGKTTVDIYFGFNDVDDNNVFFENGKTTIEATAVSVSSNKFSLGDGSSTKIGVPENSRAESSSAIEVSYEKGSADTTKSFNSYRACKICGTAVSNTWENNKTLYFRCSNNDCVNSKSECKLHDCSEYRFGGATSINYQLGKGVITIKNISTKELTNVKIIISVDDGFFYRLSDATGSDFLNNTKNSSSTTGYYKATADNSDSTSNYLEITIDSLKADSSSLRSDGSTVQFEYKWAIPYTEYIAGAEPSIIVFSETSE